MNFSNQKLVFLLIIGFMAWTHSSCAIRKVKPNVVFFFVDDLGWKDITCYGSDFYQTPNVDKLAEEGVCFTNAYAACTVCSPSRASVMTGKYPARINCTDWIEGWKFPFAKLNVPEWTMYMDTAEYTLAEMFKNAGYITAHLGKWHLGEDEMYWPENHGFDSNMGGWKKGSPNKDKKTGSKGYFSPYGNPRLPDGPEGEYLTERLANEACEFIKNNKEEPFFLNFWFYNVHTPLQAKQAKIDKYKALMDTANHQQDPTYAAMVEHMDEAIGKVVAQLMAQGVLDNTIIVFSSDNGGLVGRKNTKTNNYPLCSGKGDIYEGGVRVPAIIRWPQSQAKGIICDEPIISPDFYPTLAELCCVEIPAQIKTALDGLSLVPLLKGDSTVNREAIFWHYPHYHIQGATPYSAIRKGDYKLIYTYEDHQAELYNLVDDIGESNDLSQKMPEKVKELEGVLNTWLENMDAQFPRENSNYKPNGGNKKETDH